MKDNYDAIQHWPRLSYADLPLEVREELNRDCPDGEIIRQSIIKLFEIQTGYSFLDSELISRDFHAVFFRWWFQQVTSGEIAVNFRIFSKLQSLLFSCFSEKVLAVAQRHCNICRSLHPIDDHFPEYHWPIRLAAASRQSLSGQEFKAFQAAFKSAIGDKDLGFVQNQPLCLAFTYILNSKRNDRDLDNLTKAALDGLSRAIGFNDRFVHHLDIAKFLFADAEEYMIVRIGPSFLNDTADVVIRDFNQSWAGQPPLDIQQFM